MEHASFRKEIQFLALIVYEFVAGLVALAFDFNALWYLVVSWFLPVLFFLHKLELNKQRYIFGALLWSVTGSLLIDWIGHYSGAWSYWDNPLFASTDVNISGIPIESFIWSSLFWLFYILVYEYFFDEDKVSNFSDKEKLLALGFALASLVTVLIINLYQPVIPFFFLLILLLMIFVTAISLATYRVLISRVIKFGLMVFIIGLQIEFFSLKLGLWFFPDGDSLKQIMFFDHLIPVEEIIWWAIVPVTVVTLHKVFADERV